MSRMLGMSLTTLSDMDIKVVRHNDGPLASIAFETALPLEQVREQLRDTASLVTEITPMSIPKPPKKGFLGKDYHITTATSLPAIGFDKIWLDPEWLDGANVSFGIVDTGLDDLYYKGNDVRADWFFRDRVIEVFKARPWSGSCNSHGRLCASVVAKAIHTYEGQMWRGALTKARFYVGQALDSQGQGDSDTVHSCLAWMLERNPKPDGVTLSLGGPHDQMLDEDVARCWEQGIVVTVAAGNNGTYPPDCGPSLNCPADAKDNLALGASDGGHLSEGQKESIQTWSCRAQRPDGSKHDWFFAAPGVAINVEMGEAVASGTSLSTPHAQAAVLAVISILKIKHPDWTYQQRAIQVRELFKATALNLGYKGSPNHSDEGAYCLQGHGRIQAYEAWMKAKEGGNSEPDKWKAEIDGAKVVEEPYAGVGNYSKDLPQDLEKGTHELKITLPNGEFDVKHFEVYEEIVQPVEKPTITSPTEGERIKKGTPIHIGFTVAKV